MTAKKKSVVRKKTTTPLQMGAPEPVQEASKEARETLRVTEFGRRPIELIRAEIAIEGLASNASIANSWQGQIGLGNGGMSECVETLRKHVREVRDGDLGYAEAMLVGQASALNALFASMVASAGVNKGEYPEAFERYMRLALKAQSQCRTTLEALAEIRFPRQVAFVKQANIANGHQQVNNGVAPEQTAFSPNEVLEVADVKRVDAGAQGEAGGGNSPLEAVAPRNRAKVGKGKGER